MIRSDREIQDFDEIIALLRRCDTIRLGINGEDYPYVVPLSFGFEVSDGSLEIYVHGAKRGLKHELISRDDRVCVEADLCHGFYETKTSATTEYESIIGFGRAEEVEGGEAERGLNLIFAHCHMDTVDIDIKLLSATKVYRIRIERISGKRSRKYYVNQ